MYAKYIKRPLDFCLSLCAIVVLSPVLLVLMIVGAIAMKGNPFFTQLRPGKDEKIFRLIKFRTMTCEKDKNGELLPDEKRLTKYGKFLRSTSLDELPELFNILKGDMAVIGPRPLAVQYLPYYNEIESLRHTVRPGLTGMAQVNGRNALNWDERFRFDVQYVENLTFNTDFNIFFKTINNVLKRKDVVVRGTTQIIDFDKYRKQELEKANENV